MNRISLAQFIIFGLLAWGLPAFLVAGPKALILTLACVLPVWWINRGAKPAQVSTPDISPTVCALVSGLALVYVLWDMFFGRRNISDNIFLQGRDAFEISVDQINANISKGRGFVELLGSVMLYLPFCLVDLSSKIPRGWRRVIWCVAGLCIFNEVGAGRTYLLLAAGALAAGRVTNPRRLIWVGAAMLAAFAVASYARGDFSQSVFSNPLFDGVAFPYINLGLLINDGCAEGAWYGYLAAFFNKFLPAFIFSKHVFSFNVEMSMCIYPWMESGVTSASIFTYLGEFFYYRPPIVTALIAGVLLGILARIMDHFLIQRNLLTTRLFAGLGSVAMLRSRSQDLLSSLLSLGIFLVMVSLVVPKVRQSVAASEPMPPVADGDAAIGTI